VLDHIIQSLRYVKFLSLAFLLGTASISAQNRSFPDSGSVLLSPKPLCFEAESNQGHDVCVGRTGTELVGTNIGSSSSPAAIGGSPALGAQVVGNRSGFVAQISPVIDARSLGADCTNTFDSAAVLNHATIAGQKLSFPGGCHIKLLTSNWLIKNQANFVIEAQSNGTQNNVNSGVIISYCGPDTTAPSIDFEYVRDFTVRGLTVESQGQGCANSSGGAIRVDEQGGGGIGITTDGLFERMVLIPALGGTLARTGWCGFCVSPVSGSNVEDMRIHDSVVFCNDISGTQNTVGLNYFTSFNAKEEEVRHVTGGSCATWLNAGNSGIYVHGSDGGNSQVAVRIAQNSDPGVFDYMTDENSPVAISAYSLNWPITISHSHWAPGLTASSTLPNVDLNSQLSAAISPLLMGNGFEGTPVPGYYPLGSNAGAHLTMINNSFRLMPTTIAPSGPSGFIMPNGHQFGYDYSNIHGGMFRIGAGAGYGSANVGYGFFLTTGTEISGTGWTGGDINGCNWRQPSCLGHNVMYLGNANIYFSNVWPVPIETITCRYAGADGSTHYPILVIAIDAAGNRAGLPGFANEPNCVGAATLGGGNSLTVTWGATNATKYDVVVLNPANSTQGWLAGTTASTTLAITTTPGPYTYIWPNQWEDAITNIQGEALNISAPTKIGSMGTAVTVHQHARLATGRIGATTRTEVLLTWPNTFTDSRYTVSCIVEDSTTAGGTQGLTYERIRTKSAAQVGLVINNPTAGALTGSVDCIADHD